MAAHERSYWRAFALHRGVASPPGFDPDGNRVLPPHQGGVALVQRKVRCHESTVRSRQAR
jgi:hypothetical protein